MQKDKLTVIAITGPTASGKTELVLRVAEETPIEVISCDSRKVFKHLDIGTAKPSAQEQEKVTFHMIDVVEPTESFSVEKFRTLALKNIREIFTRKRLPVLEGGTGLYIASIAYSLELGESPPIEGLRKALNERFDEVGYLGYLPELLLVFGEAEKVIDVYNPARMIRFIENSLIKLTTKQLKDVLAKLQLPHLFDEVVSARKAAEKDKLNEKKTPDFCVRGFVLQVDRNILWNAIRERVRRMFAEGIVNEVRELLNMGVSEDSQALTSITYAEAVEYLKGNISLEEAEERAVIATRQYAKRQDTWNKHQFPDFTFLPYSIPSQKERALKVITSACKEAYSTNLSLLLAE